MVVAHKGVVIGEVFNIPRHRVYQQVNFTGYSMHDRDLLSLVATK